MTGIPPAGLLAGRRRSEAFERLSAGDLDLAALSARDAAALAPLLEVVSAMRAVAPATPRPEFVADLRERLMAEAETALVPIDTATEARLRLAPADPGVRRHERRLATVLGGAVIVGTTASVAVAAQGALPGEALYPVKRAIENVHADATTDDVTRATRLLGAAHRRLEEIEALTTDGSRNDVAALPGTIRTFTEQAGEAGELLLDDHSATGRESSVARLRDFTGPSMTTLARLEATVPDGALDELLEAAGMLASLDERAATACPTCGGAGITEIPRVLASASSSAGVTVPVALPGADPPRTDRGSDEAEVDVDVDVDVDDPDPDRDRRTDEGTDPDDTGRAPRGDDPATAPEPPLLPPTVDVPATDVGRDVDKDVRTDVGDDVTGSTTDAIDTITDTVTVTGTVDPATDGSVVGGVVDGVDDVVDGTGDLVDGPLGGLGGLGGG